MGLCGVCGNASTGGAAAAAEAAACGGERERCASWIACPLARAGLRVVGSGTAAESRWKLAAVTAGPRIHWHVESRQCLGSN